jgi:16S rRNA (guanine966-N2)-methyltransferase
MLQPWIPEARVLDLFAGSGAVGIELVSRGAVGAQFVEISQPALKCLRSNMAEAQARASKQGIPLKPWQLSVMDALQFVKSTPENSFELIWADPPYEAVVGFLTGSSVDLSRILSPGGIFALESGLDAKELTASWGLGSGLMLEKQREYGVSLISIWRKS